METTNFEANKHQVKAYKKTSKSVEEVTWKPMLGDETYSVRPKRNGGMVVEIQGLFPRTYCIMPTEPKSVVEETTIKDEEGNQYETLYIKQGNIKSVPSDKHLLLDKGLFVMGDDTIHVGKDIVINDTKVKSGDSVMIGGRRAVVLSNP